MLALLSKYWWVLVMRGVMAIALGVFAFVWPQGTIAALVLVFGAIVLAVWGAAVVSTVDNFLRPRLLAGRVQLSGLAMFVAMLGGLQAFGALGIILGPVLFATAAALLNVLRETQPSHALRGETSEQKVV